MDNLSQKNNLLQQEDDKQIEGYFQFVLFGGTGDLAHNKLIPAFYNLIDEDVLPREFSLIATGRRYDSEEEYLEAIYSSLLSRKERVDNRIWQNLRDNITYLQLDFQDDKSYITLKDQLERLSRGQSFDNRIFYLATAPAFFGVIARKLEQHDIKKVGMNHDSARLVIEKPFGHNRETARKLNQTLTGIFPESQIYRIDHYLGKEMIQNIMVIRLANPVFRNIWNQKYIDNIQIYATESAGINNRSQYYDEAGVLKDMFQNHMLQMLALIAMEEPEKLTPSRISSRKVEIFRQLARLDQKNPEDNIVRGQYTAGTVKGQEVIGYRQEKGIPADSKTATFLALKLFLHNQRWQGVPFYLKSGKRLDEKRAEIVIEFKEGFHRDYLEDNYLENNVLVIKIQPEEGIYFRFNTRKPGSENTIVPVNMEFCQTCHQAFNSPEAYEGLIYDMIRGDKTLFTGWQEVYNSWKFIDKIKQKFREENIKLSPYEAGSTGPRAAQRLLEADNRHWWDEDH